MNLYFPTSSLNFNDFFATESISPKAFYATRTFGTKRHFTTELNFSGDSSLTWFTVTPMYSLVENSDSAYEEYPIIIELECDPHKEGFIRLSDEVYSINRTIYFNPQNVSFLFLSEEDMRKTIIKSKLVDETKLVEKYKNNMSVISRESLVRIEGNAIQELLDVDEVDIHLFKDKYFNHIKGFLYAWITKAWLSEIKRNQTNNATYAKYQVILQEITELSEQLQLQTTDLLYYIKKNNDLTKRNSSNEFEFFPIDRIENHRAILKPIINDYNEQKIFEMIINSILASPKSKVGEVGHQELIQLINNVKQNLLQEFRDNSTYIADINVIQRKLADRVTEIRIEDVQSTSLKNFMVFVLKCNNSEEMDLFLKNQRVDKQYLSYAYLGAFFGFSGLSRRNTYELLDGNNYKLFDRIDVELGQLYEQIMVTERRNHNRLKDQSVENKLPTNQTNQKIDVAQKYPFSNITNNQKKSSATEGQLVKNISEIRRSRNLPFFLKNSLLYVDEKDNLKVIFDKVNTGVDITFHEGSEDIIYFIHLKHESGVSNDEKVEFKKHLKRLGLSTSLCQSDYPVFEYNKKLRNQVTELNDDEIASLCRYTQEILALKNKNK